ncbi:MAG: hypothetical protein A4E53_01422 [Pelotomaculum sp. PtaB.Bin104]|nr:MAG: hypothetical protein A4E53_01422 [Pelotomaculum sp. PtaB.Bin104]
MIEGVRADDYRYRHSLALGYVSLGQDHGKLAGSLGPAGKKIIVMDHEAVHAPVFPVSFRVFIDDNVPGGNIAPAVSLVNERRRELVDVRIFADKDIFLTGRVFSINDIWLNPPLDPLFVYLVDLPQRRVRIQSHRQRHPPPGTTLTVNDRESRIIFDILKHKAGAVLVIYPAADRP